MPYALGKERFAAVVEQAIAGLPPQFKDALVNVAIELRDRPSRRMLKDVGLSEDELLLGLYVGVPLTERHVEDAGQLSDMIYLFQDDIEDAAESEADAVEQTRITLLHEIGHYFGLDEDELEKLGYG